MENLVPPDFNQNRDALNLGGHSVEDAIKKLIPKIGIDQRETEPISRLIMSEWAELPGNPPDVAVQFAGQIVVTEGGRDIVNIPT